MLQELLWFLSSYLLGTKDSVCPLWSGIDGCGEEALKQVRRRAVARLHWSSSVWVYRMGGVTAYHVGVRVCDCAANAPAPRRIP